MKKILNLCVILILSILSSCAGNYSVLKQNNVMELKKPQSQIARVVFIRPQSSGPSFTAVYDKDDLIGILPKSSYFAYDTKPGKHIFGAVFLKNIDFVEANIEGGKTYYVFYATFDAGIRYFGKILAIKKDTDQMRKVEDWLSKKSLKQSALTDEGINQYKVQKGENGCYIKPKPGAIEFTINIEKIRKKWLQKAKKTGKSKLLSDDGI